MLPLHDLSARSLEQMSDEEFWDYAHERANVASRILSPEEGNQHQYLECELSQGGCLLPLKTIVEVIPPPHLFARLPLAPSWMRGIASWRGETIAVIDLDMYLSGRGASPSDGMLLVANHADLTVGLLVPGIGQTTAVRFEQLMPSVDSSTHSTPTLARVVSGVYAGAPVLDMAALLTGVVQQIGMAAHHE